MKQHMANITQEQDGVESFNTWIEELEEGEQPEACDVNNSDCENCGSWNMMNPYSSKIVSSGFVMNIPNINAF